MGVSKPVGVFDASRVRSNRIGIEPVPVSATEVDLDLVDRAVRDLNAIYTTKALETACEIGEYVIGRFFGGSLDKLSRYGDGHASFRALTKHPELRFSATYLWTAVAVVGQLRELPEGVGCRLPLSHHRLLMPLRDPSVKTVLARKALNYHFSKRELAREIGRLRQRGVLRRRRKCGRSEVLKAMSQLVEASEDFVRAATSEDTAMGRPAEKDVNSLLGRLELDLDAVRCTVEMLRSRLPEREHPGTRVSPAKH